MANDREKWRRYLLWIHLLKTNLGIEKKIKITNKNESWYIWMDIKNNSQVFMIISWVFCFSKSKRKKKNKIRFKFSITK